MILFRRWAVAITVMHIWNVDIAEVSCFRSMGIFIIIWLFYSIHQRPIMYNYEYGN